MSLKLLDLGAELPLLTQETIHAAPKNVLLFGRDFTLCPDLAEGQIPILCYDSSPMRLTPDSFWVW